jgi:predicted Zn-dependent protease
MMTTATLTAVPGILTREEAEAIARRALSFSRADQARVNISSSLRGNTRFAINQITTGGDLRDLAVVVTSAFGQRVASATSNRVDDESLRRVVETSERLARLVPENPEYMGELGPQEYPQISSLAPATAELSADQRATAVNGVTGPAAERGFVTTSFLSHGAGAGAVATSGGLFAYNTSSRASFTTTVRTPDGTGSGWAGSGSHDWGDVDVDSIAARAVGKAELSRQPREVEPGRWTVILEPTAAANMINLMMNSLAARPADEGRSFFARPDGGNRIGERFADPRVTIWSDPNDTRLFSAPFSGEGLPNRRMVWVEDGTLRNLVYDRFWASRQDREPTGFVSGWYMEGGSDSLDAMIRATERGLLVTRMWYIRSVNPRTILFTGLTRDGTFLVENGRVAHAVKNLRWNESPISVLNNLEMLGAPERVVIGEAGDAPNTVFAPPMKVRNFSFTSVSDAI